jgi:hypothetical protein
MNYLIPLLRPDNIWRMPIEKDMPNTTKSNEPPPKLKMPTSVAPPTVGEPPVDPPEEQLVKKCLSFNKNSIYYCFYITCMFDGVAIQH